jgi:mercuric ion binding protein
MVYLLSSFLNQSIMKTFKLFSIIITCLLFTSSVFAQKEKTASFKVSGECNMCKKKIETAAKEAGATFASWSPQTKILKVSYNVSTSSTSAIQQTIANTGYDTPGYKAPSEAYDGLSECCKYQRQASVAKCCDTKCDHMDGKCADMQAGKTKDCGDMTCCKKS